MADLKVTHDFHIECDECGRVDDSAVDITTMEAAKEDFKADGWVNEGEQQLCSDCAEDDDDDEDE